ncbi:hypothetical protein ScPMuIL_013715 [Solemya velum]
MLLFNSIALVVGVGNVLPIALTKAIVSSLTPADKQGAIFASFAAVETFCHLCSGVIVNAVYSSTVDIFPGFVFLVLALCYVVSSILLVILIVVSKFRHRKTGHVISTSVLDEYSYEVKSE